MAILTRSKRWAYHLETMVMNRTWDLVPDPLVKDDQAIVVNVRNKGLIIITGCSHAGILNTVNYAKKVTRIDKVYAGSSVVI